MCLGELPDDVLLQIFFYCDVEDITSVQRTNRRLFQHISEYRLYYSKIDIPFLDIFTEENGHRVVRPQFETAGGKNRCFFLPGLADYRLKSLNPVWVISFDHDELANMSPIWWKDRRRVLLHDIIDYRRYLRYIDRWEAISLVCDSPKNLTEILQSMKTKHLRHFGLEGDGELECTDDDLKTIAKLSYNMASLDLENVSQSSKITNNGVLDLIEMGSFCFYVEISISRIENFENIGACAIQRKWVAEFRKIDSNSFELKTTESMPFVIKTKKHTD